MRESGALLPIFSLPSKFGIGCFSREAYEFVDFLEKSGQGYWQILPIGPTGFGDSPYQPFSAFAGNPYFISLEDLINEGYLTWDDVNGRNFGYDQERVDYSAQYQNRYEVLRIAAESFFGRLNDDRKLKKAYEAFVKKEEFWLSDYALFNAIKASQDGKSWLDWEDDIRTRKPEALEKAKEELEKEINVIYFHQFMFDAQWTALKEYANSKNVKIIGDLPFYVSMDSADAWSHPEAFLMDRKLKPKAVAGCPPDAFSATGQLWGNPIYDWKSMKKDGYSWWVKRIERNYEFFDVIRIDHFHGFCDYYAIPYGSENATKGKMHKGPGMDLFNALNAKIGDLRIIAEDLGNVTEENVKLLEDTGFPGMKVLQYAFTSWDSAYVNHRHINNCVVYTGTHDNTTTRAWVEEINEGQRDFVRRYINSIDTDYGKFVWDFIREAYRSVADLCIIPIQDYLCKGKEARINMPGSADGNWQWRLVPNFLSDDLAKSIREMTELYSRIPKDNSKDSSKNRFSL